MRLSIGSQPVSVNEDGKVVGSTPVVHPGDKVRMDAVFVTPTGELDPRLIPGEFQMHVSVVDARCSVVESASDPFSATLNCAEPNAIGWLRFSLYNVVKKHDTWGPVELQFSVGS